MTLLDLLNTFGQHKVEAYVNRYVKAAETRASALLRLSDAAERLVEITEQIIAEEARR